MRLHELCDSIRASIQADFADTYRVTAEISSLSAKPGGHCFLELIEKRDADSSKSRSSADIIAKVRATCWANVWTMLSAYFQDATGMPLQAGMQVEVDANVDYHPVYGLSLVIVGINPEFTLGGLMRQRRETIARLEKEGMMELQPALTLPTLVRNIAVISAAGAAGYQDFTDQLTGSGYAFRTQFFPATMQGETAPFSIMAALDQIYASDSHFDIVVIIRGGGANTDLTCFDNYELCSFCAQFPLPILSGIGHTRDVSILDINEREREYCDSLRIRKLTACECMRLMGFEDTDYQAMVDAGLSSSAIYHCAGDSIVVDVLYYIFKELV